MLILHAGQFEVIVENDSTFTPGAADNLRTYEHVHQLEPDSFTSSRHAVTVRNSNGQVATCLLMAGGGATDVHDNAGLVLGSHCLVAIGSCVASLDIPSLHLNWVAAVDQATCFGIYHAPQHNCLISHGELEIARLSHQGEIIWKASGADIFTKGFTLQAHTVEAVDFNGRTYVFDIRTGQEVEA